MLENLINENDGMKSLSGKVTLAEHAEFLALCEYLGLSRSKVVSTYLGAALTEMRSLKATRPAAPVKPKRGRKPASLATPPAAAPAATGDDIFK